MALYILHSIFHLARLLYVRPETFGPYYVYKSSRKVPFILLEFQPKPYFLNEFSKKKKFPKMSNMLFH
jgi:hypothetical protein